MTSEIVNQIKDWERSTVCLEDSISTMQQSSTFNHRPAGSIIWEATKKSLANSLFSVFYVYDHYNHLLKISFYSWSMQRMHLY